MARIIAGLFFLMALTRAYFDWQLSKLNQTGFEFLPIGQIWFDFDRDSFIGIQPGVERYISPWVWEKVVGPMMFWPLAPTLFFLGLGFSILAIWRIFRS